MKSSDSWIRVNGPRLLKDLEKMKEKTETPGKGVTRFSYGAMDREARAYLVDIGQSFGLSTETDPVGNMFFRFPEDQGKPVILAGSHIDTVQNGGWLDGIYGTLSVLEAMRRIREEEMDCGKPIQLVVFAEEEGSNFGSTLAGSKFLTGKYGPENLKLLKTQEGVSLGEILEKEGYPPYNPNMMPDWRRIQGMLELHIEQGPVLARRGIGIGIVNRIYGMKVVEFTFVGVGNHAGASPMEGRQDALVAAAAGILEVESCGIELGQGQAVATVGKIQVLPNGSNVIPQQVTFTVEVRSANEEAIHAIMEEIQRRVEEICKRRNIRCLYREVAFSKPDSMNPRMVALLEETAHRMGEPYLIMNSGAVHDACMLAPFVPTGMIFVPSMGGRSHVPQEDTRPEDLIKGADFLLAALLQLADCK